MWLIIQPWSYAVRPCGIMFYAKYGGVDLLLFGYWLSAIGYWLLAMGFGSLTFALSQYPTIPLSHYPTTPYPPIPLIPHRVLGLDE